MAENTEVIETPVVTEQSAPAEPQRVTVSSHEEYRDQRKKGVAPGLIDWRRPEDVKTTEPAKPAEAEPAKEPEPKDNNQETSEGEVLKTEEEQPKTDDKQDKRRSLIEDVQKQRQRAQKAEQELSDLRTRLEALEKGKPAATAEPEKPAKEEKKAPLKLEHPGEAPDFLAFDTVKEFNKANGEYLQKLVAYQTAQLKQELQEAYESDKAFTAKEAEARQKESEQAQAQKQFFDRIQEASKKQFPGLQERLSDPQLPINTEMAAILRSHARGVEMANFLVDNPDEMARIFAMKRHSDIGLAMGEIAASVKAPPPQAKAPETKKPPTSNAPQPPVTVPSSGGSAGITLQELANKAATNPDYFLVYKERRQKEMLDARKRR